MHNKEIPFSFFPIRKIFRQVHFVEKFFKGFFGFFAIFVNYIKSLSFFAENCRQANFLLADRACCHRGKENRQNRFLHFLCLLGLFVSLLNVDTFSSCVAADCDLYNNDDYADCLGGTSINGYQCGGGSGSCSDVCGGCGWQPKASLILNARRAEWDNFCSISLNCESKVAALKFTYQILLGKCGVAYRSATGYAPVCTDCPSSSFSSSSPSSSSSSLPSSSSSAYQCQTLGQIANSPNTLCSEMFAGPASAVGPCGNGSDYENDCRSNGYCGAFIVGSLQSSVSCWLGRFIYEIPGSYGSTFAQYVGCRYSITDSHCQVSSSAISSSLQPSSSSSAPSSDSGSSSDSGGGGSDGGESSSGSGGDGSGDGGSILCGWGDYPPCETYQVNNPPGFCELYPDLCYEIGGIDDTISRYGSAITDSLGRLIGILDSLDLGGVGSCLDSADCPPGDFSGDSVPFVPGDSSESGSGGGSGSGGVYSWLQSVLSAASIPAAARSCPSFPSVEIELGDDTQILDFDICKEELHIGGYHPLELFGIVLRAISCLIAVYVALGAVTSLNAGFHKMRRLGG